MKGRGFRDVTTAGPGPDRHALDGVLTAAANLSQGLAEATWELTKLQAMAGWALRQQPIHTGDLVVLTEDFPGVVRGQSGWHPYRECLRPGATGIVQDVAYIGGLDQWSAYVRLDVAWTRTDAGAVMPASEPVVFCLDLAYLRVRTKNDKPLTVPAVTR